MLTKSKEGKMSSNQSQREVYCKAANNIHPVSSKMVVKNGNGNYTTVKLKQKLNSSWRCFNIMYVGVTDRSESHCIMIPVYQKK